MKVSFFEMCEGFSQLVASAMDIGLYRAQRKVENFRDFFVGATFDMPEQNAGAVLGTQCADGCFDGPAELLCFDRVERGLLPGSDLERRGLHRFRGFCMRGTV